jgi:putative oxidoreductase
MSSVTRVLPLVGRLGFSLLFLGAAPRHFSAEGIQHAADLGVPLASLAVPLSGVLAIVGGLSLLTGLRAKWGAWALVAFMVPVTLMMHRFWAAPDAAGHHVQLAMFAKNVALTGALLHYAFFGAGPLSVDAMLEKSRGGGEAGSSARA